jgi:hypothetical protein
MQYLAFHPKGGISIFVCVNRDLRRTFRDKAEDMKEEFLKYHEEEFHGYTFAHL